MMARTEVATEEVPQMTESDVITSGDPSMRGVTRAEPTSHRPTRGGDLIPRTKLGGKMASVIAGCALFGLATGSLVTLLGVIIHGLMGKYATRGAPILWWAGLAPFSLGVLGFYAASSRSRRHTYVWGMGCLLVAVTQTALMGWVGNFTTSHYDVWPLHSIRNGTEVCRTSQIYCICQDYYHGVYSTMELPGVHYEYIKGVKWRRTIYDGCGHLGAITTLYYALHATWGMFLLVALVTCGVALAGSVCASQKSGAFQRLHEEGDVEGSVVEESMVTTVYTDEPLQEISSATQECDRPGDRRATYDPGSILETEADEHDQRY